MVADTFLDYQYLNSERQQGEDEMVIREVGLLGSVLVEKLLY